MTNLRVMHVRYMRLAQHWLGEVRIQSPAQNFPTTRRYIIRYEKLYQSAPKFLLAHP
jgi:hypothetical protein